MAVSVIEVVSGTAGTIGTAPTIALTTTPAAGDVVVVQANLRDARAITAASGMGGTWSSAYTVTNASTGSDSVWIGEGVTASGTISLTVSGAANDGQITAWLVRGLPSPTATGSTLTGGTLSSSDTVTVADGDFVIGSIYSRAAVSGFSGSPAGWTAQTSAMAGSTGLQSAHFVPSSSGSASFSFSTASSFRHAGIVRFQPSAPVSVTGTISATAPAPTVTITGTVPAVGQVTATAPAPEALVSGAVGGIVGGTVQATASAPVVLVEGTLPAPVTGTVQATAAKPVLQVVEESTDVILTGGGVIETMTIELPSIVMLTDVTLTGGGAITVEDVTPVTVIPSVVLTGGGTITARPDETLSADPRTGGPQWRYVVTELDGTPLGELVDVEHGPVEDGIETPAAMDFTIATSDPARALIRTIERQCQVWEGSRLLLRGPILPARASDDGDTVTYRVHDPSWWWRDGRRVIGRVPMTNLLTNGDFSNGLAGWVAGFDADSIPAAKPTVTVVDEDFSMDDDGLDPIKAAQIVGVESVTTTETELQSSAVYYPNRPFAWEPLAAGFRPEGPAAIDAVAAAMPTTAGLKVLIVGHTANDGTGSGMALSLRRAQAAAARVAAIRPGAVITTKGVGFYEPNPAYPVDSQQQRRVVISYEQTVTIDANSKQWIRKTIAVTQPKAARYPLELTAAAMLKVADDWSVADANMLAIKVVARRGSATVPWDAQLGVGSTSISDTDPVDRWLPETASVTIPADDRTYNVDVYLYAAAALTRYTAVGLFPAEALYFWGVDQALIARGIGEHMQDPAMGKGPLGLTFRTPLTGIRRDRMYLHRDRMPVDTALEQLTALNRGMNIDVLTTPSETTFATFYPRQGQVLDYQLVQGGNVARAVPATTRDVGSSIIAQAQGLGSYRAEAYAQDATAFGGLLLERVITAEQEAPLNELGETARQELAWAGVTTVAYWVDIDPARIAEVKSHTSKGDTVRLILDSPEQVDALARIVKRQNHPSGYRLLVALED